MTTVVEHQDLYLEHFTRLEKQRAGHGQPWLDTLRQQAIHRFAELGFPTTKLEAWKYTNVAPIARVAFQPAPPAAEQVDAAALAQLPLADLDTHRLVFVNGRFAPALSAVAALPRGVAAGSLAQALADGGTWVRDHLARHADFEDHAFVALNTAFLDDGAVVRIPKNVVLDKPLHLLFLSVATGETPGVTQARVLVELDAGAQASVIETYVGLGAGVSFTNAVTEAVVGENAVLDHYRLQRESEQAFHIGTLQVHLSRNSSFLSDSLALGAALARVDSNAVLDGEGVHCELDGLYLVRGRQHVDNHTLMDHARPHGTSHELYKGILDGHATGVFNGAILVRKDAQKTDGIQHNKNLLLSPDALINTKPQLEIFADDVRCTHGATIGHLDEEALFYLRARGLAAADARALLIYAFAAEVVEDMKLAPLRDAARQLILDRLAAREPQETTP